MNPQKTNCHYHNAIARFGHTIYAVIEYLHNQGKIAPFLSGVLFVILFSKLYFDTKKKKKIIDYFALFSSF